MEERKFWLEAIQKFRDDINSLINCPSCKKGNLFTLDIAFDEENIDKGGERYIKCTNCNKFEIVLYHIIPLNWYAKKLHQKTKIIIKQKLHLGKSSFSGVEVMDGVLVEFYCANGGGIKHEVFVSPNSPYLNDLVSEGKTDFETLSKNGVATMSIFEKQTPLLFQYQFFKSKECKNDYLIIFRLGEWQNGRYMCKINAIFEII